MKRINSCHVKWHFDSKKGIKKTIYVLIQSKLSLKKPTFKFFNKLIKVMNSLQELTCHKRTWKVMYEFSHPMTKFEIALSLVLQGLLLSLQWKLNKSTIICLHLRSILVKRHIFLKKMEIIKVVTEWGKGAEKLKAAQDVGWQNSGKGFTNPSLNTLRIAWQTNLYWDGVWIMLALCKKKSIKWVSFASKFNPQLSRFYLVSHSFG